MEQFIVQFISSIILSLIGHFFGQNIMISVGLGMVMGYLSIINRK